MENQRSQPFGRNTCPLSGITNLNLGGEPDPVTSAPRDCGLSFPFDVFPGPRLGQFNIAAKVKADRSRAPAQHLPIAFSTPGVFRLVIRKQERADARCRGVFERRAP